jgi:hypothetical protein
MENDSKNQDNEAGMKNTFSVTGIVLLQKLGENG